MHPVRVHPASQATVTCQSPEEGSEEDGLCLSKLHRLSDPSRAAPNSNQQALLLTQPPSRPQSLHILCSLLSYLMAVQRLNRNPEPVLPPHLHASLAAATPPYRPPQPRPSPPRPGAVQGVVLQTFLLLSSATVGLVTAPLQVRCFQTSESHSALLAWMILSPRYTGTPLGFSCFVCQKHCSWWGPHGLSSHRKGILTHHSSLLHFSLYWPLGTLELTLLTVFSHQNGHSWQAKQAPQPSLFPSIWTSLEPASGCLCSLI